MARESAFLTLDDIESRYFPSGSSPAGEGVLSIDDVEGRYFQPQAPAGPEVASPQSPMGAANDEFQSGVFGTLVSSFGYGLVRDVPAMYGAFVQAIGDSIGEEQGGGGLSKWGENIQTEANRRAPFAPPPPTVDEDGYLKYAAQMLGSGLATTVPGLVAGGGAGLLLRGATGAAKLAPKAAAIIASAPLNIGETALQLRQEGMDPKTASQWALVSGVPITALDMVGLEAMGVFGREAKRQAKRSLVAHIAVETGRGSAGEATTEHAQSLVREWLAVQLGGEPSADRFWRSLEEGLAGGLVGGTLGGGISPFTQRKGMVEQARETAAPVTPADEASPLLTSDIEEGHKIIAEGQQAAPIGQALGEYNLPGLKTPAVWRQQDREDALQIVDFLPGDENVPAAIKVRYEESGAEQQVDLPLLGDESIVSLEQADRERQTLEAATKDIEGLEKQDQEEVKAQTEAVKLQETVEADIQKAADQVQQEEQQRQQQEEKAKADQADHDRFVAEIGKNVKALEEMTADGLKIGTGLLRQEDYETVSHIPADRRKNFLSLLQGEVDTRRKARAEHQKKQETAAKKKETDKGDAADTERFVGEFLEMTSTEGHPRVDLAPQVKKELDREGYKSVADLPPNRRTPFLKAVRSFITTETTRIETEEKAKETAPAQAETEQLKPETAPAKPETAPKEPIKLNFTTLGGVKVSPVPEPAPELAPEPAPEPTQTPAPEAKKPDKAKIRYVRTPGGGIGVVAHPVTEQPKTPAEEKPTMKSALGSLGLHVDKNPAGSFSFVGSVPGDLSYRMKDGSPVPSDLQKKIRDHGPGLFKDQIEPVTYKTREEAVAAATAMGLEVAAEPTKKKQKLKLSQSRSGAFIFDDPNQDLPVELAYRSGVAGQGPARIFTSERDALQAAEGLGYAGEQVDVSYFGTPPAGQVEQPKTAPATPTPPPVATIPTKAGTETLADLKGSKKQRDWGSDIRKASLAKIDELIGTLKARELQGEAAKLGPARVNEIIDKVRKDVAGKTFAKYWINRRQDPAQAFHDEVEKAILDAHVKSTRIEPSPTAQPTEAAPAVTATEAPDATQDDRRPRSDQRPVRPGQGRPSPGPGPLEGAPAAVPRVPTSERGPDGRSEAGDRGPRKPVLDAGQEESGTTGSRPPSGVVSHEAADGGTPAPAGARPSAPRPTRPARTGTNYRITSDSDVGVRTTELQIYQDNLAAIQLLKQLQTEERLATPEEQAVLVKYRGWGGVKKIFGSTWTITEPDKKRRAVLADILTDEEFNTAARSVLNAHYTSPEVVEAMWAMASFLGIEDLAKIRVLEPAAGIGNFIGMVPEALAERTAFTAVEMDGISAGITRQLYQREAVQHSRFEDAKVAPNFYDLVITNVPFHTSVPTDRRYNKHRLLLHDYFLHKSVALTRPGGLVVAITSKGTMDKLDSRARERISDMADLVGAVRLPEDAFMDNAKTTVTTDILVFRRKVEGETFEGAKPWVETEEIEMDAVDSLANPQGKAAGRLNEYYQAKPDMMLGEMYLRRGRYGNESETALRRQQDEEGELDERIRHAFEDGMPSAVLAQPSAEVEQVRQEAIEAEAEELVGVEDGTFTEREGELYLREGTKLFKFEEVKPAQKRDGKKIRAFGGLVKTMKDLLAVQQDPAATSYKVKKLRRQLNQKYDQITKQYSSHLTPLVEKFKYFKSSNPDTYRLLALEIYDEDANTAEKVSLFKRNTLAPPKAAEIPKNPQDALVQSLNRLGRVNMKWMSGALGLTESELAVQLKGVIFHVPGADWVTAEEYLSGNVREKLQVADGAASADDIYKSNVEALQAVQPEFIPAGQIRADLGDTWIPVETIQEFILDHMGLSHYQRGDVWVTYSPEVGRYRIMFRSKGSARDLRSSVKARQTWGTNRRSFFQLMDNALNGGFPTVKVQGEYDAVATTNARAKLEEIQERFRQWIWEKNERAADLSEIYNRDRNNISLPEVRRLPPDLSWNE